MKLLIISILIALLPIKNTPNEQRPDPCRVFGSVFEVTDKRRATYFVYRETEDDYSADLRVYKETNRLFADQAGRWFFCSQKGFADFTVYYTSNRAEADFTVFFTDNDFRAGCN